MPASRPPARVRAAAPNKAAERAAELARLVPLWPAEIADLSRAGRARLAVKLALALKAERRRGRAGHWTYDLGRHAALLAAWRRERAAAAGLCEGDAPKRRRAPAHRPAPSQTNSAQVRARR